MWSVECGVWSVECGVWSVECGVWSAECGVWSVGVEYWPESGLVRPELDAEAADDILNSGWIDDRSEASENYLTAWAVS